MGLVKRQRVLYNIGYFRNKEKYKASAKTGQKQWISENQEETFMKRETVIAVSYTHLLNGIQREVAAVSSLILSSHA